VALSVLSKCHTVSRYTTRAYEFVAAHNPLPCAHVGTTCVLCTAVIPDLTYIALYSHLLHCADLHLTHSCSATYRSAVLRRTAAERNYVEMNCCTEFHPDRSRNTEVTDSERIFIKLTLDRQGCLKNSCSEFRENTVRRTVAGTR